MKILVLISILAFVVLLDLKCAEGSEERMIQNIDIRNVPSASRRRGRPFSRPGPLTRPSTEIEPENSIRLEFSDESAVTGGLEFYGYKPYPSWIYLPEHGKIMVYVLMPDGSGWTAELEKDERFNDDEKSPVPKLFQVFLLPTGTILAAKLKVFDRNRYRLFVPHLHDKTHIFVAMPNGDVFTGHFR